MPPRSGGEKTRGFRVKAAAHPFAPEVARRLLMLRAMSFANLVDRVRYDFTEMPNLELTVAQAVRLWNLGADDCRYVLDSLVDVGFLRWTPQRTVVRTGRALGMTSDRSVSYIPVRVAQRRNNAVG